MMEELYANMVRRLKCLMRRMLRGLELLMGPLIILFRAMWNLMQPYLGQKIITSKSGDIR